MEDWDRLLTKTCLLLIGFVLAAGGGRPAFAEDWPAWRKDGSGVSQETNIPPSWGPEENIRWKTALPGSGISSPIVWKDRVFLTSAVPGTTTQLAYAIAVGLLWVLTLAALWWSVDGTADDPLGEQRCRRGAERSPGSFLRKLMRVIVFIGVAYAVLIACEQLRDSYPEQSAPILGRSLEYNGHGGGQIAVARFWISKKPGDDDRLEINPQLPRDCYFAGFLGAFVVLGLGWIIRQCHGVAQTTAGLSEQGDCPSLRIGTVPMFGCTSLSRGHGIATWIQAVLVTGIAGTFLVAVNLYALAEPPHADTTTWYRTAALCLLGLIAAVGSFPQGSGMRGLAASIALLVLMGLLVQSLLSPKPADWHEDVWATRFPVYWEVALVMCGWFGYEYLARRRSAETVVSLALNSGGFSYGREIAECAGIQLLPGPWALLLACLTFFVPANYFPPASVLLRQLLSIDRDSGAIRWATTCAAPGVVPGRWATAPGTLATPTPVTDGEHVYAHFGGVGVYCLDFDGRLLWAYDDLTPPAIHQAGSSPILWQDLLLLTFDVDQQSFTLALNKQTGQVRWKADRTRRIQLLNYYTLDAYSTPLIVRCQGRAQLVEDSNFYLCAYDLPTGKELWHLRTRGGQIVPSPVVWKDMIIVPGGTANKGLMGVRLRDAGGSVQPREVWRARRHVPEVASPLVYQNYLYTVAPTGIATCRQPYSKKIIWKERLGSPCHASIAAADGKIFFCDVNGVTTVVAAGPEFRLLSRNPLGEPVQASLAISGGHIFIRGEKHLFCIGSTQPRTFR
jgi:outer membrane protein assembly factor BamB